jgi:hypothetical protein
MEVGASTLGVAVRVKLTFGCAMGAANLGEMGRTLGALGDLCGSVAGEKGGLWMGEAVGLPVCRVGGEKGCWVGVLVGQYVAVWRCGGVAAAMVHGSSHQLKVAKNEDNMELGAAGGGGSIGDGVGDGMEAVDNGVGWCDSQDGEIVVTEVD